MGQLCMGLYSFSGYKLSSLSNSITKKNYKKFYSSIQNILPCGKCQFNMKKHLAKYPLSQQVLSSKKDLVKWTIDLHNVVNYYTGKEMLSYNEAINEINKIINAKNQPNYTTYFILVAIVVLIIVVVYIKGKSN